jgi:two-component system cell cycle response regulator
MGIGKGDDDLLRTGEVPSIPIGAPDDEPASGPLPVDLGGTHPPPRIYVKRFDDEVPTTVRIPGPASDDGWLGEDTSLTRATEKSLAVPASVKTDRATLTVLTGLNAGQILALDGFEHVLGRGTDADLWLEDPAISRAHARVLRRPDGHFSIEDAGSTNGTFVSGRRVHGRADLESGDRIQLGPTQMLRFAITDDAEEELQRRLYESSTRDALTRAFNRKYLNERLLAEVAHSRRHKTQLTLLMLDLDRFKEVNDEHGHQVGDMVLRVAASHLQRLIRIEDVLARYGGEEFVILARSTLLRDAGRLAERVRSTIERLQIAPHEGYSIAVTVSIGIAALSELSPEAGPNDLIALADGRLYRAKLAGRNRVCSED